MSCVLCVGMLCVVSVGGMLCVLCVGGGHVVCHMCVGGGHVGCRVSVGGHIGCCIYVCGGAQYVSCVCLCGDMSMLVQSPMEVRRGLLTRTGVTGGCI